jgi:hypothetical protein
MMLRQLKPKRIVLLVLGFIVAISAIDMARRQYINQKIEWKRNIFADGAGYYVYLPWFFIYDCNASQLPENIEKTTGYGFKIIENKVKTKYTIGIALMQTPVFLLIHYIVNITGGNADGFSEFYQFVSFFSALIYSLLGLYLLFRFLRNYFSWNASILSIISIFIGSNLYYYVSEFPAMSHVYSFALFSAFLYFSEQLYRKNTDIHFVSLLFIAFLIVLIRPTNVFFLFILFFVPRPKEHAIQLLNLFNYRRLLWSLLIGILVFAPQLIYWHYISGNYIYYSYQNEGFANYTSPVFELFLFSPNNGLFPNTPLWFILLGCALYLSFRKNRYSIFGLSLWLIVIYLGASWFDWRFGCSIGSRTTVEYLAVFALPLACVYDEFPHKNLFIKSLFAFFVFIAISVNLLIGRKHLKCFMGENDWDWKYYTYLIRPWSHQKSWQNPQFEASTDEYIGDLVITKSEKDSFSKYFKVEAEVEFAPIPVEAEVFIAIVSSGSSNDIQHLERLQPNRNRQTTRVMLPPNSGDWQSCKAFVWNKSRSPIAIKKLRLTVD